MLATRFRLSSMGSNLPSSGTVESEPLAIGHWVTASLRMPSAGRAGLSFSSPETTEGRREGFSGRPSTAISRLVYWPPYVPTSGLRLICWVMAGAHVWLESLPKAVYALDDSTTAAAVDQRIIEGTASLPRPLLLRKRELTGSCNSAPTRAPHVK